MWFYGTLYRLDHGTGHSDQQYHARHLRIYKMQQRQNCEVSRESDEGKRIASVIRDTISEHTLTVSCAGTQLETIHGSIGEIVHRADDIQKMLMICHGRLNSSQEPLVLNMDLTCLL